MRSLPALTQVIRAIVLGAVVALAAGCGGDDAALDDRLRRAEQAWTDGEVTTALIELKAAVQSYPDSAEARHRLAQMHLRVGDGKAAEKEIDKALELGLAPAEAAELRVRALALQGKPDVALARLEAGDPPPGAVFAPALRGMLLVRLDRTEEAFEELERVLASHPDDPEALLELARLEVARERLERAAELVARSLEQDHRSAMAHLLDSDVKFRLDDRAGAHAALDRAAKWNPYLLTPQISHIHLYVLEGEFDAAREVLAELKRKYPDNPTVIYYEGFTEYSAGDLALAYDRFRKVLSRAPNHPPSLMFLGFILAEDGRVEQAVDYLTQYRQLRPGYAPVQKMLANIEIAQGEPDKALASLAEIEGEPDAEVFSLRARAYFAKGDVENGIKALEAAAERGDDSGLASTQLILAHTQSGDVEKALEIVTPYIGKADMFSRADSLAIYAHLSRGDWDEAIALGMQLREKLGDDPALLNALGTAYSGKGDFARARELLDRAVEVSPLTPTVHRNLAVLEARAGNNDAALEHIATALDMVPTDVPTLTLAGLTHAAKGDAEEAARFWEQARAADPRALEARLRLGSHYLRVARYEQAIAVSQEALEIDPTNLAALLNVGHGLRAAGNLSVAEKLADGLDKMYPDSPKVDFLAGFVAFHQGRFEDAERYLRDADAGLPENADVLAMLAKTRIAQGAAETEIDALFSRIDALEPASARLRILRGEWALARGDADAAVEQLASAYEQQPIDANAVKYAHALARTGRGDEALEVLSQRLAESDRKAQLYFWQAQTLELLGRTDEAAKAYEQVLKMHPENVVALNNLALLTLPGDAGAALTSARKAYELLPGNTDIAHTYGWVLVNNNRASEALAVLEPAARAAPADGELQYHLAVALARERQREAAIAALERALAGGAFESREQAERLLTELTR